jgi:hypothetical protein
MTRRMKTRTSSFPLSRKTSNPELVSAHQNQAALSLGAAFLLHHEHARKPFCVGNLRRERVCSGPLSPPPQWSGHAILMLRLKQNSGVGIAGKHSGNHVESGQRLRFAPPHRRPSLGCEPQSRLRHTEKKRWLLWLEDTSSDASRRAAAHRTLISNAEIMNDAVPQAPLCAAAHLYTERIKDHLEHRNL